ncbi:MAG: tRNA pseudouridine(38-40) synthase TruA [Candidatus Marinimicrobia bacterium]|nr:tRNA pseudouridine(38-40) synthase TruA [Candidatus Neomarinimicrobiota bacterium]MBL7022904.1 tRNA pseudouridine(38-40) synthase TruA [Candidatus Neomarinimicrobiota bacterium]MBL7109223.1 tRNA pseudouridine(38-40) synthase TruA [Candidatus Neomarinimicrobiota bacterium]
MKNYKLTIEYDGTNLHGWQVQPNGRTVQGDIESAFTEFSPEQKIVLIGSGRTDSGVHARGQIANIKLATKMLPDEIRKALNSKLENDIWISDCQIVDDDFHARFSAKEREYSYHITTQFSPITQRYEWWVKKDMDTDKLYKCAKIVIGDHDFTSFCKANAEVKHKRCIVFISEWEITKTGFIYHIKANRFLQHMVRFLVGTMVEVARGRMTIEDFEQFIHGLHSTLSVFRSPANGLFLERIIY